MWIAFRTITIAQPTRIGGTMQTRDDYSVHPTEAAARALLELWRDDANTYCAGVAKITAATEPHFAED